MRRPRSALFGATLFIAVASASCDLLPHAGISRQQAIDLAMQGGILMQPVVVVGAREGSVRQLRDDPNSGPNPDDLDRFVWAVTLQGRQSICTPLGACVVAMATSTVYLDHATGAVVFSETIAHPGPFPN